MPERDEGTPPTSADEAAGRARLEEIRERILELDRALVDVVGERRDLVLEVGRLKAGMGLPVLDPGREAQVVRRAAALAREHGVDGELVRDVIWRIMASARDAQEGHTRWGPPAPPADAGATAGET
ncbi:MAG: chorismate mutase [Gemmatimonadetes bacterium]|nr:chorismate mutase [Gemmatimonadota bacterium]MBT8403400.1 chorismate mutase [Gemmatimonadota bacterium]NNF38563.1 chorismate mutase [Gemmatimonadota bacterium]NNK61821.1 chorismate mutase [Gemmatimonadota bacterium]